VTPIYHGITMRNIDLGPSHWPGTPMPGENGNTVFPGHRVTKTRPFRNIDRLVVGDQAIFTVNGVRSVYVMTANQIVKPTQMEIIDPTPTPTATIVACHPPGSARQRFVVKFALVQE
jgi:sortase A